MKKIVAIILVCIMALTITSCFADSLLKEFDEKLNGTWETIKDKYKPDIEKFTYPSNNEKNVVSSLKGINDSKYNMYLVEEGTGNISLLFVTQK